MLLLTDTELWLSLCEVEETVGAIVSMTIYALTAQRKHKTVLAAPKSEPVVVANGETGATACAWMEAVKI